MKPRRINYELVNKLAGYGPYGIEKPTEDNLGRLADPAAPLHERIRLLQAIAGGMFHYEEAAACLDEDPLHVMRCKALVLEESLADKVAGYFQFDFAAPRTQQEAIYAHYGDDVIGARDTGLRVERKELREAGTKCRTAELWAIQDLPDRYTVWVIQDEKTQRWQVANDNEWTSLQLVTRRPGSAREAIEIVFEEPLPNARYVTETRDTHLLDPISGARVEAWMLTDADRHPTWFVLQKGGYWTLASSSWQHALNQAVQHNQTTEKVDERARRPVPLPRQVGQ